jgi:hypothetical protein
MFQMKRSAALLVGALALASCSETTSPDAVDTGAIANDVAALTDIFDNNAAYQSMLAASFYFPSFAATNMVRATLPRSPRAFSPVRSWRAIRPPLRRVPGETQDLPFPVDVQGKTFVWNASNQAYEPHPTRTGAPADGIRIILYTLDQFGQPTNTELGYLDLDDQTSGGTERLGVLLRLGATTIASYYINPVIATNSRTLLAAGYITGATGQGRVDFSLEDYYNSQSGASSFDYTLTAQGGAQIVVDVSEASDGSGSGLVRVSRGDNSIEVTFTATASSSTGEVRFNGVLVATVTQSGENPPVFTGADGRELSQQQREDLGEMFIGIFSLVLVTLWVFGL